MELIDRSASLVNTRFFVEHALKRIESTLECFGFLFRILHIIHGDSSGFLHHGC